MFNRGKLHPIRDAWIEIAGCWRRREYPSRIPYGMRGLKSQAVGGGGSTQVASHTGCVD